MRKILVAVAAVAVLQVTTPLAAQACACGGFVSDQKVQVKKETAIVELSAGKETVTMQFAAETTATKAAWVMPVPAKADLALGDAKEFEELDRITAPEYRDVVDSDDDPVGDQKGAASAPGDAVTVTEQTKIGPYDVAQLTGTDPSAVANWLTQNGFTLPQNLASGLTPYLAEGWSLTAVRLTAQTGGSLRGVLPPLRLTFDTATPIYPMRLSGLASTPQALRLYVLADHRMDATSPAPDRSMQLYFAGRHTARADKFVTRYDARWNQPSVITQDIRLTQSASDATHREVITRRVRAPRADTGGGTNWMLAGGIGVAALLAAGGAVTMVLRRRS